MGGTSTTLFYSYIFKNCYTAAERLKVSQDICHLVCCVNEPWHKQ